MYSGHSQIVVYVSMKESSVLCRRYWQHGQTDHQLQDAKYRVPTSQNSIHVQIGKSTLITAHFPQLLEIRQHGSCLCRDGYSL